MNKYNIEITEPAENDLYEIGKYIAEELLEPKIAANIVEKIGKEILELREMPFRNPVVPDEKLAAQGIRKFIIDNYIVFYIVNKPQKRITIVRILYKRRDWMNIL